MRRSAALATVLVCALVPGALAAVALADDAPAPVDAVPPTYGDPPAGEVPAPAASGAIAAGVTVAGVRVGGLRPPDAYAAVRQRFERPLTLDFRGRRLHAAPAALGAVAFAKPAVSAARRAAPGTRVPLAVSVRPGPLRHYLRVVAARLDRRPVDATVALSGGRPVATRERRGLRLAVEPALRLISAALEAGKRGTVPLPTRLVEPQVTRRSLGALIVIHRGGNRLDLYQGARLEREFQVATGQSAYPTPLGAFSIVVKWKDPWWYPPASPWAAGEKPTPPGPGNPLGTRWMGISAPGVGIHGTPNSASVGYSLSHGCIRMLIPQAEWLFDQVDIGTPVYIVES